MSKLYLITGAAGHLGTILVSLLLQRNEHIRTLVLPGEEKYIPSGVEICCGDITKRESLRPFFERGDYDRLVLIHCAAIITIASKKDPAVWNTNVNGTTNIMRIALEAGVERVIYVSSVHAIQERSASEVIAETKHFSPELVHGQYAKSKAEAARRVLIYAGKGLNVSIVHPSGIIGPGDVRHRNYMVRTLWQMAEGKIPVAVAGGYDFVDSRDVAEGILACEENGKAGECYILNGHYITILSLLNKVRFLCGKRRANLEIPYGVAKTFAPLAEKLSLTFRGTSGLYTPYSVYTLHTNAHFSHEKAKREFGYRPRNIDDSIKESLSG